MDNSPLGRLPAELRNRISELSLTCHGGVYIDKVYEVNGLTSTCRQMRREAHLLFFRISEFIMFGGYTNGILDLATLPAQFRALGVEVVSQIPRLTLAAGRSIVRVQPGLQPSAFELPRQVFGDEKTLLELYRELGLEIRVAPTGRGWIVFPPTKEDAQAVSF